MPAFGTLSLLLALLFASLTAGAAEPLPLEVEAVQEKTFQGAPALAVVLSDRLDPGRAHDDYLSVYRDGRPQEGGWVLSGNGHVLYFPAVEPTTRYTVLVRRGLSAANGRTLPAHHEATVTTRALQPQWRFAGTGHLLPPRLGDGLPVETLNVEAVDVEFLRVPPAAVDDVAAAVADRGSIDRWQLRNLSDQVRSVYMARFAVAAKPNTRTVTNLPVGDIPALREPGFYLALMRAPGSFEYQEQAAFFFVSDIGLHLRKYPRRLAAFAASVGDGSVLADVRLTLYDHQGKVLGRAFTDADGFAELDFGGERPALITASRDDHASFVHLDGAALDLSAYPIAGPPQRPLEVYAWAPRDLYRPGESVPLAALLRDGDGGPVPALPLNLRVVRADGREAGVYRLGSRGLGYYGHTITIPGDAPTGRWAAELRVDPKDAPLQVFHFLVEEFLPERMAVDLEAAADWLLPGSELAVAVSGRYLYGAPAAGNRLRATLQLRPEPNPLPALARFRFGNPDDAGPTLERELWDGELDADGRRRIEVTPVEQAASPLRAAVVAELFEPGGRPVTRRIERVVWPATEVVGVRPLFRDDTVAADATARFELARVTPTGEALAAAGLEVQVIREERDWFWAFQEGRGWQREHSETSYPVLRRVLSFAAGERAEVAVPVEWGRYRIDVRDPATGLLTRYRFQAGWSDQAGAASPDKVELSLDKPGYRAGEVAQLTLLPPHPGEALVTVEGDGLLWQARLNVPAEGATVAIPIDPEWRRHDLYVATVVLRGAAAADKATPARAVGLLHLPLARAARRLEVAMQAPPTMEPERDLEVAVRVAGAAGREARVVIAAVDVGVLGITDFASPDPFAHFFARRRYGVDLYDLYHKVIEHQSGPKARLAYGGDLDLGGLRRNRKADAEVRIVALWSDAVALDDDGGARIALPVPDFNGTLRLMAVAFTDDAFGAAQREVTVRAPVVAELALPRFLGSGDQTLATLEVHNLSGAQRTLAVTTAARAPLRLTGEGRAVTLADGERRSFTWLLEAQPALGVGRVRVDVSGDGIDLQRSWELAVRPPFPGETRARREALEPGASFSADGTLLDGLMESTVDAALLLSSRPPLNLAEHLRHLLDYPYGCTEQTTSSTFPLLFADAAAQERFDLKRIDEAQRLAWVQAGIARLVGKQRADGGFSLWGGDGPGNPWLTAYAGHFLVTARERGFPVPRGLLDATLARLQRTLGSGLGFVVQQSQAEPGLAFAARAYAGYVLALAGRAPLGDLRSLADHHADEAASPLALGHLAAALHLSGDRPRAQRVLAEALETPRRMAYGDYGSPLRDSAALLYLIGRHDLPARQGPLLLTLADQLRTRRWLSTQERVQLFLAGLELGGGEPWQATLAVATGSEALDGEERRRVPLTPDDLRAGLHLSNTGNAPLYLALEVNAYPAAAPAPSAAPRVVRKLYDAHGKPLDQPPTVGELIVAHTRVHADTALHHGLLVDLLPAGLELENQNLQHSRSLGDLPIEGIATADDDRRIQHREFRDDRFAAAFELSADSHIDFFYLLRAVTPGVYTWPAPTVEDMYRPEIRGVGEGGGRMQVGGAG